MKPNLLIFLKLFILLILSNACAQSHSNPPSLMQSINQRLYQIWVDGNIEFYLPLYAWHNRYTYSPEKIKTYNEMPLGGGLGKGLYDEKGNWHGLYALVFLDSHKKIEPGAGYAYLKVAHLNPLLHVGAGISLFITARQDIYKNRPFPGILPWVSLTYARATFSATYIPGAQHAGNVLFIITKWRLS